MLPSKEPVHSLWEGAEEKLGSLLFYDNRAKKGEVEHF